MTAHDDEIIEAFFGENARASELRELKETLQARLKIAVAERDALPESDGGRAILERKIRELKEQVTILAEEEAVSTFVEDSVRAMLSRPESVQDDDGGPY